MNIYKSTEKLSASSETEQVTEAHQEELGLEKNAIDVF